MPARTSKKSNISGENSKFAKMLSSDNIRQKTAAGKLITRQKVTDTAVLDLVEKELLAGYKTGGRDRNHSDAMSWLCKALGASGNKRYEATLNKVAKEGSSRKLKKYANKSLSTLKRK